MDTEIHKTHIPDGRTLSRPAIATLTFVIFMSLTLVSWSVVQDLEERHENTRFDKRVAEVIHKIEHHFSGYEQVLKAALGHLLALLVGLVAVHDHAQRVEGVAAEQHVELDQVAGS